MEFKQYQARRADSHVNKRFVFVTICGGPNGSRSDSKKELAETLTLAEQATGPSHLIATIFAALISIIYKAIGRTNPVPAKR